MKKMILGLALFVASVAGASTDGVIFPRVSNFGSYVQVQIWNHDRTNAMCSGSVYMNLQSGRRDSQYIYTTVWAGQSFFRNIYPMPSGDRIISVSHSIFCH